MSCSDDPTCQELLDHLYELVDADADAEAIDERSRALLAAHAAVCPACRDAVDAERHVRDLLRRCWGEDVHAPAALRVRVVSVTTHTTPTAPPGAGGVSPEPSVGEVLPRIPWRELRRCRAPGFVGRCAGVGDCPG